MTESFWSQPWMRIRLASDEKETDERRLDDDLGLHGAEATRG